MRTTPNEIRYQIITQGRDNKLTVSILEEDLCFLRSAHQIFINPVLLNGFSQEEAALIGYIAGTESK